MEESKLSYAKGLTMTILRFSDGMAFNLSGPARPVRKSDGWYCVGAGCLIPCDDYTEAKQEADRLNKSKEEISMFTFVAKTQDNREAERKVFSSADEAIEYGYTFALEKDEDLLKEWTVTDSENRVIQWATWDDNESVNKI
jgi:hypothetical protein